MRYGSFKSIIHYIIILQLKFYKDQNNDLLRRLDDFEKTIASDVENASVIIYNES